MVDWNRFEFMPEWGRWWRSLIHDDKVRATLRACLIVFLVFGAIAVVAKVVQEWDTKAVVETLVEEVARRPFFLALLGIALVVLALLVLLWVVGVLWAWIMLPFTIKQGVAALNDLRREVRRFRRRMSPAPTARDDDFDDLEG